MSVCVNFCREKGAENVFFRKENKVWLAMGNSFIKLPKDKAQKMLKKDQVGSKHYENKTDGWN